MSISDEITKEKQRVSEALSRVDAQREKLSSQLNDLEATERVLARYGESPRAKRKLARASTAATDMAVPARSVTRQPTATSRPKHTSPSLNDQVLALATGKTQQEIAAACKGARPNHVGAAVARHKRAGRIQERAGRLYATQLSDQRAAV